MAEWVRLKYGHKWHNLRQDRIALPEVVGRDSNNVNMYNVCIYARSETNGRQVGPGKNMNAKMPKLRTPPALK